MRISTDDVILLFYSDSYTIVKVKNQTSERGCVSRQKGKDKGGGGGGVPKFKFNFFLWMLWIDICA